MARTAKKRRGWLWAAALFFSAGYIITALGIRAGHPFGPGPTTASAPASLPTRPAAAVPLPAPRSPVYAIAVLVALTIPFAARTTGMLRGAVRGLGLGLAGAAGVCLGLSGLAWRIGPEALEVSAALAALTTLVCCAATGAVFGLLAERRQRRLYGENA